MPFTAQLFVATTGSDSNSGTSASSPKRTISAALAAAAAGQTISVAPGSYSGFDTSKGGNSGSGYITIRSEQKHAARLTSGMTIQDEYVRLQDFEITGSSIVFACDVTADNVQIIGNHIHHVAQSSPTSDGGSAIECYTADGNYGPLANILIEGNLIHDIGEGVGQNELQQGVYATGDGTGSCIIRNNVIYAVTDFGIHGYSSSGVTENWKIINNTVVGCGRGILTTGSCTVRNNISYQNDSADTDFRSGGTNTNNLTSNPSFVDAASHNYRLQSGSAAINAGTSSDAPTTDYDGATRPANGGYDIGAFEFGGTVTPDPAGGGGGTSSDPDAILIVKAPTGTNTITGNMKFATTSAASLVLTDGAYRRDGYGPLLVKLERADVGINGDLAEADGTGLSIGGTGGDTGGTPGGGGGTGTATDPGELLKVGLASGYSKFNIGIGFIDGDPLDRDGDGHVDFTLAEIDGGLVVPGHFEMTPDNQRAKLTCYASGGTTSSGTANSRTELRELALSGNGSSSHPKAAWDPTEDDHKCFTRTRVLRAPAQKPQIVIVQAHDADDDTAMLLYYSGHLQCRIGDTVVVDSGTWSLGTDYDAGIQITDGQIKFWFGPAGNPTLVHEADFPKTTDQYFKTGNYGQFNESNVDDDEYSVVEVSAVMCWHTGYPEPAVPLG